jgi:hypothetical protein
MKLRKLMVVIVVLVFLSAAGCTGMSNLQYGGGGAPTRDDCNGDVPSPYPPYCRPVHN